VKLDCVRIIEAGYAPTSGEQAWLADLLEPFEPLSQGLGVVGTIFDLDGPNPGPRVWASRSTSPEVLRAYQESRRYLAREHLEALRQIMTPRRGGACWASALRARLPEEGAERARAAFAGTEVGDSLGVLFAEPGAPTVTVNLPYPARREVPPRTIEQLRRVTAHLTTALRLRARLQRALADGAEIEAVLDPGGRVCDATGAAEPAAARASLTEAVRSVERARGRLRRTDPEEALAIWRALFDGRWSIIERTESDGKRLLLARRNAPGFRDPKAVAPGERDVLVYAARGLSNKYIGYLLGVATSTVATRLASALRKLGLTTRREAIAMLGGVSPPPAESEPAAGA